MQRTLRNLAVALVAGTFAVAAAAQDKAEKASKKAAASASGKHAIRLPAREQGRCGRAL